MPISFLFSFFNVKTFYLNDNISCCVHVSGDSENSLLFSVSVVVEFVPLNIFY